MNIPLCTLLAKGVAIERWDCLRSSKGGKRGDSSADVYGLNPCFCPFDAYCKNMTSGGIQRQQQVLGAGTHSVFGCVPPICTVMYPPTHQPPGYLMNTVLQATGWIPPSAQRTEQRSVGTSTNTR